MLQSQNLQRRQRDRENNGEEKEKARSRKERKRGHLVIIPRKHDPLMAKNTNFYRLGGGNGAFYLTQLYIFMFNEL